MEIPMNSENTKKTGDARKKFIRLSGERIPYSRFDVCRDRLRIGREEKVYTYVSIREGVCILPFYRGRLVLLREYRYPFYEWIWEIPGGLIEPGEDAESAAVRELEEETGYPVRKLAHLGEVYTSVGSSDEKIHLFAAQCGEPGEAHPEYEEEIETHLVTQEAFQAMLADGTFRHAQGLSAYALYQSRVFRQGDIFKNEEREQR